MGKQQFSVNNHPVQFILSNIEAGIIAIPEIQRPFVWNSTKVRDLIDSLYRGYPIGYIISWKSHDVILKDGTSSFGKSIIIDGQQRITALMTSLLKKTIINKDFKRVKYRIAFNPMEESFEVFNSAIERDNKWINDISDVISNNSVFRTVKDYCNKNNIDNEEFIFDRISKLKSITNVPIGVIDLEPTLDIQTVTEIFIRINSKGVVLSQADFAMSKIASDEKYGGNELRKCIDYFCHMAVAPEFYYELEKNDEKFSKTDYFKKMAWLKNENDDLYDPSYTDMLRVSFASEFERGRLSDLVALLSGRNFETRTYEASIAEDSFNKLKNGVMKFMNENNFKNFLMIIRSTGFNDKSLIRSQNTLNFAYILYLNAKAKISDKAKIKKIIAKWFVMSVLTGRYSSSPESQFDLDIRRINEFGLEEYLLIIEKGELSDGFWEVNLPTSLNTSVSSSPYFNLYLASQVKMGDNGFLSNDIKVSSLVSIKGDIHHVFPKNYLKKNNIKKSQYNQIANYVIMQSEINIAIKDKAPNIYFPEIIDGAIEGEQKFGGIVEEEKLLQNFKENCIPISIQGMDASDYNIFLDLRRDLIANKLKEYYYSLSY